MCCVVTWTGCSASATRCSSRPEDASRPRSPPRSKSGTPKLEEAGTALAVARTELVARLAPVLAESYAALAGRGRATAMRYEPEWFRVGLGVALRDAQADDVRRGVTTVGPHRDEVELALAGEPARTHARRRVSSAPSRWRCAWRRTRWSPTRPVQRRSCCSTTSSPSSTRRVAAALLANLPVGQTLLTTAADVPEGTDPDLVLRVAHGTVAP